jgi:ribA/ribD-fused uncharacterized protein
MYNYMLSHKMNQEVTDGYVYFWIAKGPSFSNWSVTSFNMNNITFTSSEQAFMYKKAIHFQDHDIARKIISCNDSKMQKSLGRQVKHFVQGEWDRVAKNYMYDVCLAKFTQDKLYKAALLRTGNKILVEASPFDNIWGIGMNSNDIIRLGEDPKYWKGTNWLGNVLCRVRSTIVNHQL